MKKADKKTNFSSRIGFVLAAAGSAVGMGNLWRFPYLAAKYGGVFRSKKLYIFMIRFVMPLCMVIILISSILGIV